MEGKQVILLYIVATMNTQLISNWPCIETHIRSPNTTCMHLIYTHTHISLDISTVLTSTNVYRN